MARQMTTDDLTTQVDAADDPAKELGTRETWTGQDVYVVRDAQGRFVTWRRAEAAEAAEADSAPVAVADGGTDEITWTTDSGADVAVTADNGTLVVDAVADDFAFTTAAHLTTARGTDVLDCGRQRDDSGSKFQAYIPVGERKAELDQLREASEPEPTDDPLRYEVTETARTGGWGQEITTQELRATKSTDEMTDRQLELDMTVDPKHDVPDGADAGDIVAVEDILGVARTRDEAEHDALDEAAETGDDVVISKTTTDCADETKECTLDHVTRVATPEGDIETRRTHTH